jgi:hypothetical protein
MSPTVVFRETALRSLAREPCPPGAIPWGTTGVHRLHRGGLRIPNEVDEEAATIYIINIAAIR